MKSTALWASVALGFFLVSCGGTAAQSTSPSNEAANAEVAKPRGPMTYLPRDSALVIGVDLEKARQSKLWAQHKSKLSALKPYDALVTQCKVNPAETISSAWIAMGASGEKPEDHVVMVRGIARADVDGCINTLKGLGQPVSTADEGLFTVYRDGDDSMFAWWVDDQTMVFTPAGTTSARLAIVADDRDGLEANTAVMTMLEQAGAGSALRVAGAPPKGSEYAASLQSLGATPQTFYGAMDAPAGIDARFVMVFDGAASAKTVHDQLANQIDELKSQPFVSNYLEGFKLSATGNEVGMSLAMSENDLNALLQMMVSFM